MKSIILMGFVASALFPAAASAQEAFAGAYVHGVDTPLSMDTEQGGADLQIGYRLAPVQALSFIGKPAPYVVASLNTQGDSSFVGAGLSWKVGSGPIYLRPEVGIVLQDGPSHKTAQGGQPVGLGSRVLFQPGLSVGVQVNDRLSIEASWIHLSHGGVCNGRQNPGLDMWGARVNLRL